MDNSIQKALQDKLYDKRKAGALELERLVRDTLAAKNHDKLRKIIEQLADDFAFSIHHAYARNGGLIGLAAASIALGPAVAQYLELIVPPVLACFGDQDARVRYYACESMYNIAKTSKGEILPYFNEMFDAMAKLAADSEMSVKNGAELLDRLIKDIISDSASTYVSVLNQPPELIDSDDEASGRNQGLEQPPAFSLPRFIPLLKERIQVMNPFTRMFLVSWITLLDSIPDLEVVSYLPSFLGGLFKFLNDGNQDVVVATQQILERFLEEIKLVANVAETRKSRSGNDLRPDASKSSETQHEDAPRDQAESRGSLEDPKSPQGEHYSDHDGESARSDSSVGETAEDWIPGQDVHIDYAKILEILVGFLGDSSEHIQLTVLRWIHSFFDIVPDEMLFFIPRLLNQVLPALSNESEQVRKAAGRVNNSLMDLVSQPDDTEDYQSVSSPDKLTFQPVPSSKDTAIRDSQNTTSTPRAQNLETSRSTPANKTPSPMPTPTPPQEDSAIKSGESIDYEACVMALTTQFLNENEATRAAALSWLIMLQKKAPKKVVAALDNTFPALLETLSDTSDRVVTRDLQLLCEISMNSADDYFTFFMIKLLNLFASDRLLLENRGNLIIRQLCVNLRPERIYRTMADCLENEKDFNFVSTMVQNLNNNLLIAPELMDLRKKLRNWDNRVGQRSFNVATVSGTHQFRLQDSQTLFMVLFKAWCHNPIATISLCLLGQAYEPAYNILQTFADVELTANMLFQIDKLVQLIESPVFTYLRLQLVESEKYPYLHKVLYGILMLLPQTAAFAALKNRLNSLSAIGYLNTPGLTASTSSSRTAPTTPVLPSSFERAGVSGQGVGGTGQPSRLKREDQAGVKWNELMELYRQTQDKARRAASGEGLEGPGATKDGSALPNGVMGPPPRRNQLAAPGEARRGQGVSPSGMGADGAGRGTFGGAGAGQASGVAPPAAAGNAPAVSGERSKDHHKGRFGTGHFGRLTSGVKGKSKK
ncbi:MAG: hypothetical protein M1831_005364 [Alyxoria varia]|nr:MAG: hypothetical protein M1831_005364 [Alyxoria varia]